MKPTFPSLPRQLLGAVLLCVACQGSVEQPLGPGDRDWNGGEPRAGDPALGDPSSESRCSAAALPPRLLLLSAYQHLSSLRALLGPSAINATDAAENAAQTKPFAQKGVVVNGSLVHQRLTWAGEASATLASRFQELTRCAPTSGDDACARRFLSGFAARAFRRPVHEEEVDDLMVVYATGKVVSFVQGVSRAVEAALAAPSFMYRREIGAADASGEIKLTAHELASELSYLLTDMPPDDALRAAADSGALTQQDELNRQVERLLKLPEVQSALTSTLISAWGLGNLFGTAKDATLYPEYTPQLQAAMFHETELFVEDVLWTRKAPLAELMSSRRSFVNQPLAALYGVPYTGSAGSYSPVTLPPERAGILTQASFMATLSRTDNTSVVARGLFVRGPLLCLSKLPGPPESLSTRIQDLLKADMTEHERAAVRAGDATCAACHKGIDPFGLLLESYDPVGKHRSTLKGKDVVTRSDVTAGSLTGTYPDALAFAEAVAQSEEFGACVARHLLAYATQNEALKATDCEVTALSDRSSSATMPALVKAVATSPALRTRSKEQP